MSTDVRPLLEVTDLKKHYPIKKMFKVTGAVKALDGVSFSLKKNETLAVVGESGCGKSTLAKVLMQIEPATEGKILFNGLTVTQMPPPVFRRCIQMIFQDSYGSLNPRKKAWEIISEPLRINTTLSTKECRHRALELMEKVGLRPEYGVRYPHMFSGGQRQRLGIARALILEPEMIICDEPVSALDVSIQAQILNLLMDLQEELRLSYLFISHSLPVVRHIADRVLVIYLGKVAEYGKQSDIFAHPKHPYTESLIASTPEITFGHEPSPIRGELPSPMNPPPGCAFHKRCPKAIDRCAVEEPILRKVGNQLVSCHLAE
jgi:dipeptide transport system ATP-binding protein